MSKKILVIGINNEEAKSSLMLQAMKEKYGDDIILYTSEEAVKEGLNSKDFINIPSHKIIAPPIINNLTILKTPSSGQDLRRERRKKERKSNLK